MIYTVIISLVRFSVSYLHRNNTWLILMNLCLNSCKILQSAITGPKFCIVGHHCVPIGISKINMTYLLKKKRARGKEDEKNEPFVLRHGRHWLRHAAKKKKTLHIPSLTLFLSCVGELV